MSNPKDLGPEILEGLDFETKYIQSTSGGQRREVKINRGDSWLLRFIPFRFKANGRWYARIAKHWLGGIPILCPRHTEEAFGGSPDSYCPVCDLSDHLNSDQREDVSQIGFKVRATPQWTTTCVVFEKTLNGGQAQTMALPEILNPYTFQHYKSSWDELVTFVRQNVKRAKDSVLDVEKGNDFYVSKGTKGLRLDKQDSAPIFNEDDPNFDSNLEKIYKAVREPNAKMPSDAKMEEFAAKVEESVRKLQGGGQRSAGGRGGRPAQRGGDQDDLPSEDDVPMDDQPQEQPRRRSAPVAEDQPADQPPRRSAPATQQQQAPRRSAPAAEPANEAPARTAPRRSTAPPPPADPEPQNEGDGAAEGENAPEEPQQAPAEEPPRARPSARSAAPRAAAAEPPPAPGRRAPAAATPAPGRARNGGGAVAQESLDEEENIPEEASDQAPPEALIDPADDAQASEAPPEVEAPRRGAASLGSRIVNRVAAVNNSAKR